MTRAAMPKVFQSLSPISVFSSSPIRKRSVRSSAVRMELRNAAILETWSNETSRVLEPFGPASFSFVFSMAFFSCVLKSRVIYNYKKFFVKNTLRVKISDYAISGKAPSFSASSTYCTRNSRKPNLSESFGSFASRRRCFVMP